MQYGFTVMAEQSTPRQMIDGAVRAEEAGFDFLMVSDHFHPWLESQGQSPFTWSVLGAIAERTERIEILTAVTCPFVATMAGRIGDAAMLVEADADLVAAFRSAGGEGKPVYGQAAVCWAGDAASARATALERWRFALSGWKVQAELPNVANFEAESANAREEDVAKMVTCGNDPDTFVEALRTWEKAGFTHLGVVQAGDDQAGFMRFWQQELRPRLTAPA
ncbi:MAG: LLM class flavin-dependent oxidoreductase [Candidatus Dormibacteraeota bacterium]|uniref:LLM class flavin-dependent oxidoreductase n=1 Tax=Candidatus Amunia macphersoniae TaxID=3127014 RepID=A0A934KHD2_9BACT|nr:LLM class flavin-dependent oxidoreductase [Candidatus Dormibacteraeota bacterium]